MKRLFYYLLLVLIIGAGYAIYINNDMGLMHVRFADYQFEATLFEVSVGVLALLLAYMCSRVIMVTLRWPLRRTIFNGLSHSRNSGSFSFLPG